MQSCNIFKKYTFMFNYKKKILLLGIYLFKTFELQKMLANIFHLRNCILNKLRDEKNAAKLLDIFVEYTIVMAISSFKKIAY